MPKLQIDDRLVEVSPGSTVLEAARRLGIAVPTMCFREGLEPSTSCMLCVVKDEGRGRLIPACAARAEEGMRIRSADEDVRRSRRATLELLFSEHVGDCEAPCARVCRSELDIPRLLRRVAAGDWEGAAAVVREGRGSPDDPCHGCEAVCEQACRRGHHDGPLAIRRIVREVHAWGIARGSGRLSEPEAPPPSRRRSRFNCAMGRLKDGEMEEFIKDASSAPPLGGPPEQPAGPRASQEAARCLGCDCRKAATCLLRRYAQEYAVRPREYQPDERPRFRRVRGHPSAVCEPGKCIRCGLCVKITALRREPLGLTFLQRGFDMEVGVPFGAPLSAGLVFSAEECVQACPTAALAFWDRGPA